MNELLAAATRVVASYRIVDEMDGYPGQIAERQRQLRADIARLARAIDRTPKPERPVSTREDEACI